MYTYGVWLGRDVGASPASYFTGSIDEPALYGSSVDSSGAMSATQIANHYAAAVGSGATTTFSTYAPANFGFRNLNSDCCIIYGVRSSIATMGWNFDPPTNEAAIMSVTAQGHGVNHLGERVDMGYMQAGLIVTNISEYGLDGDFACNASSTTEFTEIGWFLPANMLHETYQCKFWDVVGTGNYAHLFAALRRDSADGDDWSDYIDDVQLQNNEDIMPTANGEQSQGLYAITAGGEFTGSSSNPIACAGAWYGSMYDWARATAAGGGSWYSIQSAHTLDTTGDWNIGSPPGTFRVESDKKHSCP